uniref:Interleukin 12 receptor, beta 2a, like n=1 Tax=Cyprinus carpio TaxID=7962 RepID=A0A8C1RQN9_CYPCA
MAWRKVKVHFVIVLYMWICSQASCEVVLNCWWNQTLPVGRNVSVVCHMSRPTLARANSCGLCQLNVITQGHRHQFPSTCASTKETFSFSIAAEDRENIRCVCNGNTADTCNVTVRGGCDSDSAVIKRTEYMKSTYTTVWVTAENVLGSVQSEKSDFNTGHIKRPDPPYNISLTSAPLEFIWDMDCDGMGPLDKSCQVQYHENNHMDWIEVDDCQAMFVLEDPQPFTLYSFRVRCHCGHEEKVMSSWSSVNSVRTPPAAPVGQLDVWSDCAPNSDKSSCNVYWKEMPLSQARGEIISYIVMLQLENGTQVTRQRRDTVSQHPAEQSCLQLSFPLEPGVRGVFVSANTSMGTSDPTFMPFAVRGQMKPEVNLSVVGANQMLLVSWSLHPQFSESVLGYVVQHVSVVPHLCLNWVRVNRTQRSGTLKGDLRNYTAYNVSLFAVFNNHSTFLSSEIAYTLEGVPPKVQQVHVNNISHSSATLIWSPIPVNESKGVILHYLVGITETGSKISSDRTSALLSELQPAKQYQAWVSAVSAAGEGNRRFTTFSTNEKDRDVKTILLPVFIPLMMVLVLCCVKIPDPINSKTFKHMNFQHAWPRLCSPSELTLKISELEIVENLDPNTPTPPSETESEKVLIDVEPQHFQVPDGLGRTNEGEDEPEESNRGKLISKPDSWAKEYSEMVDTDEEKDDGDDEASSVTCGLPFSGNSA